MAVSTVILMVSFAHGFWPGSTGMQLADAIAVAMMVLAALLLLIACIRLVPDLLAEARADASTIRALREAPPAGRSSGEAHPGSDSAG